MKRRLGEQMGAVAVAVFLTACEHLPPNPDGEAMDATAGDAAPDTGSTTDASAPEIVDDDGGRTHVLSGRVTYALRLPDEEGDAWTEDFVVRGAAGLSVSAWRGDELLAETTTSELLEREGEFTLVLSPEVVADRLLVSAHTTDPDTRTMTFVVADPGLPASTAAWGMFEPKPLARVWNWQFEVAELADDGILHIASDQGSGAAHVFALLQHTRRVTNAMVALAELQPTVVWLGLGTRFACGTCTVSSPVNVLGASFSHQVWLDGASGERYWADAVTYHELGHVVMGSISAPQREGGPHFLGQPTHPGQAFGEGWATFFSSFMREDSSYLDRQGGTFVRYDLATRTYASPTLPWPRPSAASGLQQRMDENELAAMLWQLYQNLADPGLLLRALTSPRLREPPFARGYTRRTWSDPNYITNYQDTGEAHTYLADFLDALRCVGVSPEMVDAVTEPSLRYPYPSDSALCE